MSVLIPVTAACIMSAANLQGIHPMHIITILKVEGGKVGEYTQNTNNTKDLGPMQINDKVWLPDVSKLHFNGNTNAARRALLNDGCYNVHVGAWILRQNIDLSKGNVTEGIGRYHSWTPKHKNRYIANFKKHYDIMFGETLKRQSRIHITNSTGIR